MNTMKAFYNNQLASELSSPVKRFSPFTLSLLLSQLNFLFHFLNNSHLPLHLTLPSPTISCHFPFTRISCHHDDIPGSLTSTFPPSIIEFSVSSSGLLWCEGGFQSALSRVLTKDTLHRLKRSDQFDCASVSVFAHNSIFAIV